VDAENSVVHVEYPESFVHKGMMRFKFKSSLKFCTGIHLAMFFAAIVWLMPPGSVAQVIDQLNETFEFIFSPVPLENYYMLKDATAEIIAVQMIVMFFLAAVPSYFIGYPLFLRYLNK
jgi:hypothetical protein